MTSIPIHSLKSRVRPREPATSCKAVQAAVHLPPSGVSCICNHTSPRGAVARPPDQRMRFNREKVQTLRTTAGLWTVFIRGHLTTAAVTSSLPDPAPLPQWRHVALGRGPEEIRHQAEHGFRQEVDRPSTHLAGQISRLVCSRLPRPSASSNISCMDSFSTCAAIVSHAADQRPALPKWLFRGSLKGGKHWADLPLLPKTATNSSRAASQRKVVCKPP